MASLVYLADSQIAAAPELALSVQADAVRLMVGSWATEQIGSRVALAVEVEAWERAPASPGSNLGKARELAFDLGYGQVQTSSSHAAASVPDSTALLDST